MLNNPIRDVHTDYVPSDIFKPQDANALAQSVPYDYVITKELVDAYREENELTQEDWLDVGELLWSDEAPIYPTGRTSVSIFINFYTSVADRLDFGSKLSMLGPNGGIAAVHVYSLSPYRSLGGCGTFDLYYHTSGSENYVLFDSSTLYRAHAVYVGSFACTPGTAIWHSAVPFVYEQCLYGEIPHGYANEVVAVRQEPWMSNAAAGSANGHAIAIMLGADYCGADNVAPDIYVGASNGHAIRINSSLPSGGPIADNGQWSQPFVRANTLKAEGKALMGADHCQSAPGLDVTGLSRLDIFAAGGIVTLPKGTWYTAADGVKSVLDDFEYADGQIFPYFYINGDSLAEGQQLEVTINIVQFPPHSYALKTDPYAYCAAAWSSGNSYKLGDVVSYKPGSVTQLYEALVNSPTSGPGTNPSEWQEISLDALMENHAQAIPGRTKVGNNSTCYSLCIVASDGSLLPLYSWGYADTSQNIGIVNSIQDSYQPLHPSFSHSTSLAAGAAPAGFGILASAEITLCKAGGKILALGSLYSGNYQAE